MGHYRYAQQTWMKRSQVPLLWQGFSQYINDKDVQTFAATPSGMAMRLLLTTSTVKDEVFVQPLKQFYHNRPSTLWSMKNALYGLRTSPKQWQEHLSTILKEMGFNRLKSDACISGNVKTNVYLMAYVDDILVVGNPAIVKPCLEQFKMRLELKHDPRNHQLRQHHSTKATLTIQDSCGSIAMGQPIESRHCLRCQELSRSLQCPDEEDLRNLKQLLRYIKGTTTTKSN
eukprot:2862311-Amphidinium_carterae.6